MYQACAYVMRQHSSSGTLLVNFIEPRTIASTTLAGEVVLNDTLTSTSTVQALTAAQGKVLQDGKQPIDATLTALAGVTTAADKLIYATGVNTFATSTLTAAGRALIDDVDATAQRTTLGITATNTPSTAVGGIAATNVQSAIQELDSEKMSTAEYLMAVGNINSPLLDLPLKNSLAMKAGVGSVTFTRATTATYDDRYGVKQYAGIDEPRFEKEGLLIEGPSTNDMVQSDNTNLSWSSVNGSLTTGNKGVDNLNNMTSITTTAGTSFISSSNTTPLVSGEVKTISVYAHRLTTTGNLLLKTSGTPLNATTTDTIFSLFDEGSVVTVKPDITAKIKHIRDDIYRLSITFIPDVTAGVSVLLVGQEDICTYGMEKINVEALPFATSYIPTTDSAVTRVGEILQLTNINNVPNTNTIDTNMSVVLNFNSLGLGLTQVLLSQYKNSANYWYLRRYTTDNRLSAINESLNVATSRTSVGDGADAFGTMKRFGWVVAGKTQSIYSNGVLTDSTTRNTDLMTDNLLAVPLQIGGNAGISNSYGHINSVKIYDKALTPTEVALS
jgi:hypothetical protein